ncbi:FAD-dependent thymidylate synthase [Vibrio parahaemolyticus]|uniref:FAD-dependent thymidylate synthase n=1 Tax=Vibrio parahaemolyticus TaxID=670 RepID=UPI00235FCFF8|nr:FAD-dependent thymidylate synthase [Vibrio parahaemolyticus]
MNQIKVELIDYMGDDLRIANVARVSFAKWKDEMDAQDVRLIDFLARHEHTSPFRHTAVTIRCSAPIWLARQLGKHQVGMSWNEVSRRYVDTGVELYVPDNYRARPQGGIKQGSAGIHPESQELVALTKDIQDAMLEAYERMIEIGVAPEQARGILPQNMMTTWIWTGSLTAFFHLYRLRADGHAQLEAQHFANLVSDVIEPIFPHSWKALKDN